MSWKTFPKIELHLHLEGAADPAFIRGLAQEKSVDIGGIFDEEGAYKYSGFGEFLQVYEAATQALQSPEDFQRLTQSVLENLAEHNVVYAETFVSPDFCGGRDLGAWREYLQAMQEAHVDGVTLRKGSSPASATSALTKRGKRPFVLPRRRGTGLLALAWVALRIWARLGILPMLLTWHAKQGCA